MDEVGLAGVVLGEEEVDVGDEGEGHSRLADAKDEFAVEDEGVLDPHGGMSPIHGASSP